MASLLKVLIPTLLCLNLVVGECPSGALNGGHCINGLCETDYTCSADNYCCSGSCTDVANNCAQNANLCTNPTYRNVMSQQCRRTCGLCSALSACVDKINPSTGVSDCPGLAYLCNNTTYYTLMTQQCSRTCGRCTSG